MSRWHAFTHTLHLTALGLWLGTVVMAGIAAATTFPTLKSLAPSLPEFTATDAADHWRIAAGHVVLRIFLISDTIQFACALVAAVTFVVLLLLFDVRRARPATYLRALALGVAIAALAGELLILGPSMNAAAKAYWAAARAGDAAAAATHRAAFNDLHPIATNILVIDAVAVLIALAAGAWSLATGDAAAPAPRNGPAEPRLEPPALLRTQGRS